MSQVSVDRSSLERIASGIIDTVLAKNADYGDAWQAHGQIGALVRVFDKCMRYMNLTRSTTVFVIDESIQDTLRDLVGYALLTLLYYEETDEKASDLKEILKAAESFRHDLLRGVSGT